MAGTPDRWEWLQSAYRVFQSIGIDDCHLVTPQEAAKLNPIMSTDGLLGGMWADRKAIWIPLAQFMPMPPQRKRANILNIPRLKR